MLLLKLLSTLTVSVMGLIIEGPNGIRQCQEKCRQLCGCTSVDFNPHFLQCILNVNSSEENSIPEPSVHWDFKGTRTNCRTCKKTETCIGKLKKNRVPVGRRLVHLHADRRHPGLQNRMYATGSFKPVAVFGVWQEKHYRSLKVTHSSIPHNSLQITASLAVPRSESFFWLLDLTFDLFRSSLGHLDVFTSNIPVDVQHSKKRYGYVALKVIDSDPCVTVGKKKRYPTSSHLEYRLVFLYNRNTRKLMIMAYDTNEKNVKKKSILRYTYDAVDIISAHNGDSLMEQVFHITKSRGWFNVTTSFNFPEWVHVRFSPYVIEQINKFLGESLY